MMRRTFEQLLWRVYNRPSRPIPFGYRGELGSSPGNLPYDNPAFSERMLRLHLNDQDAAASRVAAERARQIDWLWRKLDLQPGQQLLDLACGPGLYAVPLAERGLRVTGIDFAPAAVRHARQLAAAAGVAERCRFMEEDMGSAELEPARFDAAILLYGQLAVMPPTDAQALLANVAQSLKPNGTLLLEMLNAEQVDRTNSTWWFTDDSGLWGDAPYLHLGERIWYEDEQTALERYTILHLETGQMDEIVLADVVYSAERLAALLHHAGFAAVEIVDAWGRIGLYDEDEWIVAVAQR